MSRPNVFFARLIKALESASIPYMISGSVGSSFHGNPRATNDTDIVIDPTRDQLLSFLDRLGSDCYVSKDTALQAVSDRSMFNVIDTASGVKADLIIRKNRPFSQQEFSRRQRAKVGDAEVYILSPEDSILSKLEWSKDRMSGLQFKDALGVLAVQGDKLDLGYMKKWAKNLGIDKALQQLLEEGKK